MSPRTRRGKPRRAMTLIELLLVLALLVAVAAFSLPAFEGPLEDQRLFKSADLVRAEWARARILAMESGRTQMFRYQPGAGLYRIEPWYADGDYLELNLATLQEDQLQLGGPLAQQAAPQRKQKELPEGVAFYSGQSAFDAREAGIQQSLAGAGGLDAQWSAPILFYADGESSTVQVTLVNRRETFVVVKLRGLTGLAQVSDFLSMEELPQ